jgi:hypothetical protein
MPCWHIDEKSHPPIDVNIQISRLLEGRSQWVVVHQLGLNYDVNKHSSSNSDKITNFCQIFLTKKFGMSTWDFKTRPPFKTKKQG